MYASLFTHMRRPQIVDQLYQRVAGRTWQYEFFQIKGKKVMTVTSAVPHKLKRLSEQDIPDAMLQFSDDINKK